MLDPVQPLEYETSLLSRKPSLLFKKPWASWHCCNGLRYCLEKGMEHGNSDGWLYFSCKAGLRKRAKQMLSWATSTYDANPRKSRYASADGVVFQNGGRGWRQLGFEFNLVGMKWCCYLELTVASVLPGSSEQDKENFSVSFIRICARVCVAMKFFPTHLKVTPTYSMFFFP